MRRLMMLALLAAVAAPLSAQAVRKDRGDERPAGWTVRLDRPTDQMENLRFERMGDGLHVTSGPAAIFYHTDHRMQGDFTVEATLIQMRAPQHPEAYGIFIGGNDLEAASQRYTYFIVRGDGRYMIRHRAGAETHDIQNWTEHAAVNRQGEDGRATNKLTLVAEGDSVSFRVNDTEVMRHSRAQLMDVDGQAGLRINHNLDVHIGGFRAESK
jgi:hypothetical protein